MAWTIMGHRLKGRQVRMARDRVARADALTEVGVAATGPSPERE